MQKKASTSIQSVQAKRNRQALRIRPCPARLGKLIEVANIVPPAVEIPGSDLVAGAMAANFTPDQPEVTFGVLKGFLKSAFPPQKFRQLYQALGAIRVDRSVEIYECYRFVSNARLLLIAIANSQGSRIEIPNQVVEFTASLILNEDGRIQLQASPLSEPVVGVESRRIRQCTECKRIFWAGRLDKFACTKKCTQRRRVRLWRERYAEVYKLQRVGKADAALSGSKINSDDKRRSKPQ
jgi:hypothetical protein